MKNLSKLSKVSLLLAVLFGVDKILGVARQMINFQAIWAFS